MLPYFRSMEAFFDLSLPKSWADLSDPQLLFFFRQLATDKPMAEIQTLCLCQWANVLVRCRLYGCVYLVQHDKQQATLTLRQFVGSPDISRGKLFDSIENLYLCAMNNQGLLALAQLILPSEILTNFEVVRVEEEASLIRIYLDESVKVEYKENPEIESKGFCEAVTIRDFPIRDKGVDLIVRRRKWYDKQNNRYFSDSYELKAEGTRYSKEFAAFLKGVYGDDSYDLPFA